MSGSSLKAWMAQLVREVAEVKLVCLALGFHFMQCSGILQGRFMICVVISFYSLMFCWLGYFCIYFRGRVLIAFVWHLTGFWALLPLNCVPIIAIEGMLSLMFRIATLRSFGTC